MNLRFAIHDLRLTALAAIGILAATYGLLVTQTPPGASGQLRLAAPRGQTCSPVFCAAARPENAGDQGQHFRVHGIDGRVGLQLQFCEEGLAGSPAENLKRATRLQTRWNHPEHPVVALAGQKASQRAAVDCNSRLNFHFRFSTPVFSVCAPKSALKRVGMEVVA